MIKQDLLSFAAEYNKNSSDKTTDDKWTEISKTINQTIEKNVPQKLTRARHDVPWFNNDLRRLIRKRRRYYNRSRRTNSPVDHEKFRRIRNLTSTRLKQAKAKYYSEMLGESLESNPKAFWSYIKSLKQEDMVIADLKNNEGNIISDNKQKA